MDKKKVQKLNKAVVATVLAGSGVAVTTPVLPTKANTQFSDLNPSADYYQPVMELASRGYISGYKDGTFRPNQAITRGQAAKMLAMALNLNSTNPKNPGFRDVPEDHGFYKYIAALANEGIISGFEDKTFRPNEPINRNQMAKIITLGYKFQVSTKQTHGFADVSESNANRYFIQTLYDLGITKGTTGITYSPFGSVTRGQLATFIVRAENTSAEKVKPIKEIGEVVGADVYINGIKYRVDASLRDMINEKNAAALKGAHIEGQIVGETLKNISSLTINAQGTANRMLTFDGNNTTFSGELKVQGNYILFKNWNLSGPVTIAETTRRTLSDLANVRIASLTGFGFIDWEKPTDTTEKDDDPTYNGGGNDLTDKPTIDTGGKNVDRMPVIEKYVDFSNCSVQRLVIEANRTYVAATNKIPYVSVQGWVRQFEIYANIGTLYIEPDVKTTMFGVGDIDTIYKNSVKDVFLNTDSHVKLIVVDNSGGWIDLGDHVYVDKVIIPPNKMPNDIFNDFIKDNDKIGDIEDPGGNDVDRDPIENTIIPDLEAPTAQIGEIKVQGSSMTAGIKSSEDGYYYYTIRKADDRIPTMREIIEEAETTTLKTSGTGWIDKDKELTIKASELDENAKYVLYLVTKDEADNYSDKVSKSFTTMDGTPPRIDNLTGEGLIGGTRARISFRPSEPGRYRYMVLRSSEEAPSLTDLMNQPEIPLTAEDVTKGVSFIHSGLTAQTQYTVYMLMTDLSGNTSAATDGDITYSAPFFTQALDNVPPKLTKTVLDNSDITDIGREPTKVVLNFSEALDEETAQDVKNYTLGGTGNLKDSPYKATLSANGKRVTLEIPSMAAFVNNDTLTIRIRNVEDVAGNKILDNLTDNLATYVYKTNTKPILSNLLIAQTDTNPELSEMPKDKADALKDKTVHSNEVTFNANYTGTYYYLIMPADPAVGVEKPLLSQVRFPEDNYEAKDLFQGNFALASGSGEAVVGDGATLERGNKFNIYYDPTAIDPNSNGYYIYMALRDRNGNFSDVEVQYFLPNKRDWELTSFTFDGNPNDQTSVQAEKDFYYPENYMKVDDQSHKFVFNMQFNAPMDEASVENKSNYTLEGDLAKYLEIKNINLVEGNSNKATMELGYKLDIAKEDIPVVDTYIAYYMRNNQKLTITMSGLKTWGMSQMGTETTNRTTVKLNYVDKVKPRLLNRDFNSPGKVSLAYRVNQTFKTKADGTADLDTNNKVQQLPAKLELTFSEAVALPTKNNNSYAEFATLLLNQGSTVSISNIEYAKDEENKPIENKLVITLAGTFTDRERLEMTLKDDPSTSTALLRDKASNTVLINPDDTSANKAVYVYREMPMRIEYANLRKNGMIDRGNGIYESKGLDVGLTAGYNYPGMKLHYMQATDLSGTITAETIINATSEISDLFDSREIGENELLSAIPFDAPETTTQTFRANGLTWIYIVLTDSYGNVSNVVKKEIVKPPGS